MQLTDDRVPSLGVTAGGVGVVVLVGEYFVSILFSIPWVDSFEEGYDIGDAALGEVA